MEKRRKKATKGKESSKVDKLGLLEKDVLDYSLEELESLLRIITDSKEMLEGMLYTRRATIFLLNHYIRNQKALKNIELVTVDPSSTNNIDGFVHKKGDDTNWSGRGGDLRKNNVSRRDRKG